MNYTVTNIGGYKNKGTKKLNIENIALESKQLFRKAITWKDF